MRYNNPRRNRFRSNDKGSRRNGSQDLRIGGFNSTSRSFQRRPFNRNGFKAEKLLEKYNNLAKEALSSGDKILSENYFQHADHLARIIGEKSLIQKQNSNKPNENTNIIEKKTYS